MESCAWKYLLAICDYDICTLQHNLGETIKEILDQPSISHHVTSYGQWHRKGSLVGLPLLTKQTILCSRYLQEGVFGRVLLLTEGTTLWNGGGTAIALSTAETSRRRAEGVLCAGTVMILLAVCYFQCNTDVNSFPPQHRTKGRQYSLHLQMTKSSTGMLSNLPKAGTAWQRGYQYWWPGSLIKTVHHELY